MAKPDSPCLVAPIGVDADAYEEALSKPRRSRLLGTKVLPRPDDAPPLVQAHERKPRPGRLNAYNPAPLTDSSVVEKRRKEALGIPQKALTPGPGKTTQTPAPPKAAPRTAKAAPSSSAKKEPPKPAPRKSKEAAPAKQVPPDEQYREPTQDRYINLPIVMSLNKGNYKGFLRQKDVAMVMFYDPDKVDGLMTKARSHFRLAAKVTKRDNHAYAAVDCSTEKDLCRSEDIKEYPTYKLFSNGNITSTFGRYPIVFCDELKEYVESLPVVDGPQPPKPACDCVDCGL